MNMLLKLCFYKPSLTSRINYIFDGAKVTFCILQLNGLYAYYKQEKNIYFAPVFV